MIDQTTRFALKLEPLDVLFFRDGRPFNESDQASSGLPLPQTLVGALRTALLKRHGCDFTALPTAIKAGATFAEALVRQERALEWIAGICCRGPWIAKFSEEEASDVFMPVPTILQRPKKNADALGSELARLMPLAPEAIPWFQVRDDEPQLRPLWLRHEGRFERVKGYVNLQGLEKFLAGETPRQDELIQNEPDHSGGLHAHDSRTGIGIDPQTHSAEEGLIYGARFLALKPGFGFYAEVVMPGEAPDNPFEGISSLAFGGEGRRVRIERIKPINWPEAEPSKPHHKPLLLLTTPGLFASGWRPKALEGQLVAAAVPEGLPLSGWDLARGGPKPTRHAAPAGSVYFLDTVNKQLPPSLADADEDRQVGYGCFLKGVWTDD